MTLRLYYNRRSRGIDNQPKWCVHCEETSEIKYFNLVRFLAFGITETVTGRKNIVDGLVDHVILFRESDLLVEKDEAYIKPLT